MSGDTPWQLFWLVVELGIVTALVLPSTTTAAMQMTTIRRRLPNSFF